MSLYKFSSACENMLYELRESLTETDVSALRTQCKDLGQKGVLNWVSENEEMIEKFVSLTPNQQKKRKVWKNPQARPLLALGAFWFLLKSRALLSTLLQYSLEEQDCSPRVIAAFCGPLLKMISERGKPLWPFGGESPFDDIGVWAPWEHLNDE